MPQPSVAPQDHVEHKQVLRARELENARGKLQKQIQRNRDYLRLMADNGELEDVKVMHDGELIDGEEWLEIFYPSKEKGESRSKEEIEATRRAREAARKG